MSQRSEPPVKKTRQNLVVLDLEAYLPSNDSLAELDLAQFLFKSLLLKEKDFRDQVSHFDFSQFKDKELCIFCSSDAIVPMWAYMVLAAEAEEYSRSTLFCTPAEAFDQAFLHHVRQIDANEFSGERVIVKGCGNYSPKEEIYVEVASKLTPHVQVLLFGEPCSTVPVFRKRK